MANNFKEKTETHPVMVVLAYVIPAILITAGITWSLAEIFRVSPKNDEIARLNSRISELENLRKNNSEQTNIPKNNEPVNNKIQENKTLQTTTNSANLTNKVTENTESASSQNTELGCKGKKGEFNNVQVELLNCRRQNRGVTFDFLVTNKNNSDVFFKIAGKGDPFFGFVSRLTDFNGELITSNNSTIGESSGDIAGTKMLPNVPVKASLKFESIPSNTQKVRVLELSVNTTDGHGHNYEILFENLLISEN